MNSSSRRLAGKKEYLVGVNYFGGWWRKQPGCKYVIEGNDWRYDFPERIPVLGCFNDQETMDAEIVAASEHGVDFFLMLWYEGDYLKGAANPGDAKEYLNRCIGQFVNSPESSRMKWAIEYCNHPPFGIESDDLWTTKCREWVDAMTHDSYLRVGGKAVFKIHGLWCFLQENGQSVEKAVGRIQELRNIAEEKGIGELLIGIGIGEREAPEGPRLRILEACDFGASYNAVPPVPDREEDYPYSVLIDHASESWAYQATKGKANYMPFVPSGWNPRPWKDPRPKFALPNENEWFDALERVKSALDKYSNLRLPDGTESGQKILNIYAWNEYGEGGIIAPTLGDKWMKLKAIQRAFPRS